MPAQTPNGYPYPLGTDRVMDGDDSIHNLATAVDTQLRASAAGTAAVPVVNSAIGSLVVTLPSGRFTSAPAVGVAAQSQSTFAGYSTTSPTSITIWVHGYKDANANGTYPVTWVASTPG